MAKEKGKINARTGRRIFFQDLLFSLLSSVLAFMAVRWISDPIPHFTTILAKWLGVSVVGMITGMLVTRSHKSVRRYHSFSAAQRILLTVAIKEIFLVASLVARLVELPSVALSVIAILVDLGFTLFFVLYLRFTLDRISSEEKGMMEKAARMTALVKGTSPESIALAAKAEDIYDVVGFLSTNPRKAGMLIDGKAVFHCKNNKELDELVARLGGVDCLLFSKNEGVPDKDKEDGKRITFQHDGMTKAGHLLKRGIDIVGSAILLVVFSPLFLVCAIAVKLGDGGPVIYSQERIGLHGKPFYIHKFRSMRTDAEKGSPALYAGDSDDRLTGVGRFLRAHHLDELPQLWNVLRGDMSFIGYRPERRFYIDQIEKHNPRYRFLYQIRPGVTSYATLYNGYTDTIDKMLIRLDLDLYYLRNHSLAFDAKVLALTFLNIIAGKRF